MDRIRSTIERLQSSDVSVQENCLRVLINISTENEYHNPILSLIGCKRFKELIQSNNEVIQMLSTWLLSHLALKHENSEIILKSTEIIEVIIKLFKDSEKENEDWSEKGLWLMANLTLNQSNSHLLLEYGIVEILIQLLKRKSNNSTLMILISGTLRNLLHKDSCGEYLDNQKIFCHSDAITTINSLFNTYSSRHNVITYGGGHLEESNQNINNQLILSLTSLIHVLTIYHPVIRRILAISAILLNHLISFLSSPSTPIEIKEQVIKILINLSLTEETERPILAAGAIMPLVDIVVSISSTISLKSLCVSCLANLTSNSDIRRVLRSNYLVDGLSELLKDKSCHSSQLLEACSLLIANLCIDEFCRFKISQSDCDKALYQLINYPHDQVRDSIINALENIKVPISFETQNELAMVEDMSDLDPFDSLSNNAFLSNIALLNSSNSSNGNNGGFSQSPGFRGSILRISKSMSPIHQSNLIKENINISKSLNNSSASNSIINSASNSSGGLNGNGNSTTTQQPISITPPPPKIKDEPEKLIRRGRIIKELIDTEQAYVHALSICIRVYFNPLVINAAQPPIIALELVETIFSNIDKVFRVNCEFLKKLRGMTDSKDVLELAHAFEWYWDQQFTIPEYRTYINNFNKAMETVHENRAKLPRFKEYLEKCQFSEQCKSETIDSYLIRPVQRVPRYILLLTDLLAHTVDHLERVAIQDVLKRTKLITDQLNESKRKAENLSKTIMLQEKVVGLSEILLSPNVYAKDNNNIGSSTSGSASSSNHGSSNSIVYVNGSSSSGNNNNNNNNSSIGVSNGILLSSLLSNNNIEGLQQQTTTSSTTPTSLLRELIKDGLMMESRQKKVSKYRYFILFNDLLFITKQKKNKYSIYKTIPLIDLKVLDVPHLDNNETGLFCFQINWSEKIENGMIISTTEQDKIDWITTLKETINCCKKNHLNNIMKSKLIFN